MTEQKRVIETSTPTEPVLMGSKAAALTHPAEPRATLAAWMMLGDAHSDAQRSNVEGAECVKVYDEWAADLDRQLARSSKRRSRLARIFLWGRK